MERKLPRPGGPHVKQERGSNARLSSGEHHCRRPARRRQQSVCGRVCLFACPCVRVCLVSARASLCLKVRLSVRLCDDKGGSGSRSRPFRAFISIPSFTRSAPPQLQRLFYRAAQDARPTGGKLALGGEVLSLRVSGLLIDKRAPRIFPTAHKNQSHLRVFLFCSFSPPRNNVNGGGVVYSGGPQSR